MTIADAELLAAFGQNSRLLAAAARAAGADTKVPTCMDWTVADLVGHVGGVLRWTTDLIGAKAQEFPGWPKPLEPGPDVVDAFEREADALQAAMEAIDPDEMVWSFGEGMPAPVRWWFRRMAHEAAIHRVDAEAAAGIVSRVDPPEMAADAIDEHLFLLPARRGRNKHLQAMRGDVHIHTTDTPGEWVVVFGDEGIEVRREHVKSSAAVRGPASALLLFTYLRGPLDEIEVIGDTSLIDAWRENVKV